LFNPPVDRDLQSNLVDDWFAIGFKSMDETSGSVSWVDSSENEGYSELYGNRTIPTLIVKYAPTDVYCGNGVVDFEGEECDDGNTGSFDECTPECTLTYCGDNIRQDPNGQGGSEECDDGADNGQANKCNLECTGVTASQCGNGIVEEGEGCDDGNTVRESCTYGDTGGCMVCGSSCDFTPGIITYCGNGIRDSGNGEQCDDGNTNSNDGCSSSCRTEGEGRDKPGDDIPDIIDGSLRFSPEEDKSVVERVVNWFKGWFGP